MKTKDFLKKIKKPIPKGWRRMRLGESFNGGYGFMALSNGYFTKHPFLGNNIIRCQQIHLNTSYCEGIYLKKKG